MKSMPVTILFVLLFANSVNSQMRTITDAERIGLSDLIIVGVVEEVMSREKTNSQNTVLLPTDIAIVRVEKVLKGLPITHVNVTSLPMASKEKGRIYAGVRLLFFLQKSRDLYTLYYAGDPMLRSVDEEDKFVELIKQFPVSVELVPPTTPCIYGQQTELTVKITNKSEHQIGISEMNLEGFYFSPSMEKNIGTSSRTAIDGPHANNVTSTYIKPGDTYIVNVKYAISRPESWKIYKPETHLLTTIALRIIVTVDNSIPRENPKDIYLVTSPPVLAIIGDPLPKID